MIAPDVNYAFELLSLYQGEGVQQSGKLSARESSVRQNYLLHGFGNTREGFAHALDVLTSKLLVEHDEFGTVDATLILIDDELGSRRRKIDFAMLCKLHAVVILLRRLVLRIVDLLQLALQELLSRPYCKQMRQEQVPRILCFLKRLRRVDRRPNAREIVRVI